MTDIVILTDKNTLPQYNKDGSEQLGYVEDHILKKALETKGLKVLRLSWDDGNFNWSTTRAIIFRSTWDYFYKFDAFSAWLKKVSKVTRLINSSKTIHWNKDKHYLLDLEAKGVHIAESYFIEQNTSTTLLQLHDQLGWSETVLKPCISGTARHTYKLNKNNINEHEHILERLLKNEAMMLQPFQHDIVNTGEISMMLFGGQFTHAVLKIAKTGEFRVQTNFGGRVELYQPTADEIEFAEHAIQCCPELPIYARIDIFKDNHGKIALNELELIEPELFFRFQPEAATNLVNAIATILD